MVKINFVFLLYISLKIVESVKGIERTTTTIGLQSDYHIFVDEEPKCKVDSKFLSFSIGSDVFRNVNGINFECEKLRVLFKKVSPCYIKIGESFDSINFQPRASVDAVSVPLQVKKEKKIENNNSDQANNQVLSSNQTVKAEEERKTTDKTTHQATNKVLNSNITKSFPDKGVKISSIWSNLTNASYFDSESESGDGSGSSENFKKNHIKAFHKKRTFNTPVFLTNATVNIKSDLIQTGTALNLNTRKVYNLTANTLDLIYDFLKSANSQLVFDVKSLQKSNRLSRDEENIDQLLEYVSRKKYKIIWELRNNIPSYEENSVLEYDGEDYNAFRQFLSKYGHGKIVAPELTGPYNVKTTVKLLRRFLQDSKDALNILSWKKYNEPITSEEYFAGYRNLDAFITQNRHIRKIANKLHFKKPIWVTDIGNGIYDQNPFNNSNTFTSGVSFLDNLGVAASFCMNVVIRKSFILGENPLLNFEKDLKPNPEYYLSLLFKSLVGNTVLRAQLHEKDRKFRIYSHCVNKSHKLTPGAIVVYIINLHDTEKSFSFLGYELLGIDQYLLTSDLMNVDSIRLNDKPLYMTGNNLPQFHPVRVEQPVSIPGKSFGFYVIETANFYAC